MQNFEEVTAESLVDSFLQPVDPESAFVSAANLLADAIGQKEDVRNAVKIITDWGCPISEEYVHSYQSIRRAVRASALKMPTIEGEAAVSTLVISYMRCLEGLREPLILDKLRDFLGGGQVQETVKTKIVALPSDFGGKLLYESELRARNSSLFAKHLDEAAASFAEMIPRLPAFDLSGSNQQPSIQGGQGITICTIPSGSVVGDWICASIAIIIIVVIIIAAW